MYTNVQYSTVQDMYTTVCSYGAEMKCALLSSLAARAAAGRAVHGADRGARTRLDRHLPRARQRHRSRAHSGGVGAGSPLLFSSLLFSSRRRLTDRSFFYSSPLLSSPLGFLFCSALFCSVLISGCAALRSVALRCWQFSLVAALFTVPLNFRECSPCNCFSIESIS